MRTRNQWDRQQAGLAGRKAQFLSTTIVHGGHWAARLERQSDSPGAFSTLHRAIAMDFAGATVEFRGFLRTEQVSQLAGLWMRED
ncbi:MAG TPA: hypothetical protein VGR76_15425, partial [Candidatus Angelobacter sp.]|nr:hypothetical protein [Candidatus Angelobacter sp.]